MPWILSINPVELRLDRLGKNLYADVDASLAKPRSIEETEKNAYIPLAPSVTGTGGLVFRPESGFFGNLRVRYLKSRPANEDYSLTARGYTLLNAAIGYAFKKVELKVSVENILNTNWEEAQFETESRLREEPEPVTEIHFTPGTPFFIKAGLLFNFSKRWDSITSPDRFISSLLRVYPVVPLAADVNWKL